MFLKYSLMLILAIPLPLLAESDEKPILDESTQQGFPISKETTYITEPLDREGYIDFASALNQRMLRTVTPENNANVVLWKAFGPRPDGVEVPVTFFNWMGINRPPAEGNYFVDFQDFYSRREIVTPVEVEERLNEALRGPWAGRSFPHVRDWIKANEIPLILLVEASKRSHFFLPIVPPEVENGRGDLMSTLLHGIQENRKLCNCMLARSMLQLEAGNMEESWNGLIACHRLGRLMTNGASLIEHLVGCAIEGQAYQCTVAFLQYAGRDSQQLRRYLNEFKGLPARGSIALKMEVAERFFFLDIATMVHRDGLDFISRMAGERSNLDSNLFTGILLSNMNLRPALEKANSWYDRLAQMMQIEDRAAKFEAFKVFDRDIRSLKEQAEDSIQRRKSFQNAPDIGTFVGDWIGDILLGLMMPSFTKIQSAEDRVVQADRNLHVAFALELYKRDRSEYPISLQELVPDYLDELPIDLFSDAPLIYRPTKDGYLLYSVGPNQIDTGGRSKDDRPAGDDMVIQMPPPSRWHGPMFWTIGGILLGLCCLSLLYVLIRRLRRKKLTLAA